MEQINVTVYCIYYNWHSRTGNERHDIAFVGNSKNGVKTTSIKEHLPQGEGDRLYYDVHYDNGYMIRIFNPTKVIYSPLDNNPSRDNASNAVQQQYDQAKENASDSLQNFRESIGYSNWRGV